METETSRRKFHNLLDPASSSYKCYLTTLKPLEELVTTFQNLAVEFKTEDSYHIIQTVDPKTKEVESFLFNYIGEDSDLKCLNKVGTDFIDNKISQSVIFYRDIFKNDLFYSYILHFQNQFGSGNNSAPVKIAIAEIADDILTDFVNGTQAVLSSENLKYFILRHQNTTEILEFFKSKANHNWQAFIIRILYKANAQEYIRLNIIVLNYENNFDTTGHNKIQTHNVNRALTIILNSHCKSKQLTCNLAKFIQTTITGTCVSVAAQFPNVGSDPLDVKTLLFHICFKYVCSVPVENIQPEGKVGNYITKLRNKVRNIEQETRAKVIQELSSFYLQEYSNLKNTYIRTLNQHGIQSSDIERINAEHEHALADQNFYNPGDCCSKLKGYIYLTRNARNEITESMERISRLQKEKNIYSKWLGDSSRAARLVKSELLRTKRENQELMQKLCSKEADLEEQIRKTYRIAKHYERSNRWLQHNHRTDQEIIKANKREILAMSRYIQNIQKDEIAMRNENANDLSYPRMVLVKYSLNNLPAARNNPIKVRVDYKPDNRKPETSTSDSEFVRIRKQRALHEEQKSVAVLGGKIQKCSAKKQQRCVNAIAERLLKSKYKLSTTNPHYCLCQKGDNIEEKQPET